MEEREYETMYDNEDSHWWFQGTRRVIFDYGSAYLNSGSGGEEQPLVLDVGCGTGATLAALMGKVRFMGVEPEKAAVQFCHRRGLDSVMQGHAEALPVEAQTVDTVLALDVIEHVEDDVTVLREMHRVLRPEGALVLTVPANPFLWSDHDVALHHKRRYTKKALMTALEGAGFRVEKWSFYNTFLFPLVATVRLLQRLRRKRPQTISSDVKLPALWLNGFLSRLLSSERVWLRWIRFPFGVSLIVVARPNSSEG